MTNDSIRTNCCLKVHVSSLCLNPTLGYSVSMRWIKVSLMALLLSSQVGALPLYREIPAGCTLTPDSSGSGSGYLYDQRGFFMGHYRPAPPVQGNAAQTPNYGSSPSYAFQGYSYLNRDGSVRQSYSGASRYNYGSSSNFSGVNSSFSNVRTSYYSPSYYTPSYGNYGCGSGLGTSLPGVRVNFSGVSGSCSPMRSYTPSYSSGRSYSSARSCGSGRSSGRSSSCRRR